MDDLSRDLALEVAGPTSGPLLCSKVLQLAQLHGWHLTIDAFTLESNTLLQCFFAHYAEPAAESEDAFTVTDWIKPPAPSADLGTVNPS